MARRRYGSHPLEGTCPLCDNALGRHDPNTNPLTKWRDEWAHQACVFERRGE